MGSEGGKSISENSTLPFSRGAPGAGREQSIAGGRTNLPKNASKPSCCRGPCSLGAAGSPQGSQECRGTESHVFIFHSPQTGSIHPPELPGSCLPAGQTRTETQHSPCSCAVCFFNSSCFHGVIRSRCWFCLSLSPLSLAQCFFDDWQREIHLSAAINQREPAIPFPRSLGLQPAPSLAQRPKNSSQKALRSPTDLS